VVRVRDDGRGIEPWALGNVFELFFQAGRDLDRSEGGLGIGLALVRSLVELHGGAVEARSEGLGKGTELVVRLPVLGRGVPRRAPEPRGPAAPARPMRILVVDDEPDAAESMAVLLRVGGHDVRTAHDGRAAVELALALRPEVVLLDIGLPYRNGYDACRAIRDGGLHDALVVALTGYGQEEDRDASRAAGFDAHLVKPADPAKLDELLAQRAARG
jgi:CheY-like chemotaxis protein